MIVPGSCFVCSILQLERVVVGPHDLRCIESLAALFSGIGGASSSVWYTMAVCAAGSGEEDSIANALVVDARKQGGGERNEVSGT